MKQMAMKALGASGLIIVRVMSVLLPLYLLVNLLNSLYSPPYAVHAAIIGIPSILFLERMYSRFWHRNWGDKSNKEINTVASK